MEFKSYKLSQLVKRKKITAKIEPEKLYKRVTVKLYHKGVIQRDEELGVNIKSSMFYVSAGDFILSGIDARNGAFGIVPEELEGAIITNDFWCLEPKPELLNKEFFLFLTSTSFFDYICKICSDGTTQRIRLQKDKFFDFEISIPSVENQLILVEKLKLVNSVGSNISSEITHQLDLIKDLRQAFLRQAMQGLLVSNETQDGTTGADLLAEIQVDISTTLNGRKKKKPLAPITEDEIPFDIPENWTWCRLDQITINCDSARKPISQKERDGLEKKYDYYGASGIIDKIHDYTHDGKFLLIGEDGNNLISRSTPLAFIAEGKFWVNNHAHVLSYTNDTLLYFMKNWLNFFDIKPYLTGGFQPKFSQGNMNLVMVPLPPLEIQERLVAKLDELMAVCDALETQVKQSQQTNEQLLQQVLREALGA